MTNQTTRPELVTVALCYHGAPVTIHISNLTTSELEQTIDSLLERAGWSAPASAARSTATNGYTPRERAPRVQPTYDSHGAPCCPVHRRPLSEGHHGFYCTAKGKDGEQTNDKGYCSLKFEE